MSETLVEYQKKRDFANTSEPSGEKGVKNKKKQELRFVVQHHEARRDHYDFRLEWEGVLLSWAVPKGPSYDPKDKRLAIEVEPHPLEYAEFEGTIPKGQYGGGTVMLWDEGVWQPRYDFEKGLQEGSLKILLKGKRLKGKWALIRLKPKEDDAAEENNWLLMKEKDEFVLDNDGIGNYQTSVRSGRSMREIEEEANAEKARNPFEKADVELAKLVDKIPQSGRWLYEVKYDGYRILAYCAQKEARLVTRNGHDYSEKFESVASSLAKWANGRAMVLDGEMVIPDEQGKTDFQALQNYIKNPKGNQVVYMAFDILALNGEDLRQYPLMKRKEILETLLKDAPTCLQYSKHVDGQGEECFALARQLGYEGIVGKKADSPYRGERSGDWIKLKCYNRQEFVIGGYTRSNKKSEGISALLLGYFADGKLIFSGRAGTGISENMSNQLIKEFEALECEKAYFADPPKSRYGETVVWVRPEKVAEIQFAEFTQENVLRQASFKGLRKDKSPRDITKETSQSKIEERGEIDVLPKEEERVPNTEKGKSKKEKNTVTVTGVKISNPQKVVFADKNIKKIDVVKYYEAVGERMMKYAGERVLSVVRCHKGIDSACFFKKHPSSSAGEGVRIISLENSEGESSDYFYLDAPKGLVSQVQLGTIEFHIWGSKAQTPERPDMMVFDLDPDEGMDIERIRQGVRDMKSVFDQLKLKSYLKTSGGKGYHIVLPFCQVSGWDVFHDFAERIAQLLEAKWPDRYTSNIRKENRKGRIFIDWIRNGRGATSVAPYSLRARQGAFVSMPITWEELDSVAPNGIDMHEALRRIHLEDPWDGFEKVRQTLL